MTIHDLLRTSKTIAVVGISDKPDRPSNDVARQLQRRGYTIIPVSPQLTEWNGIPAYSKVSEIPEEIAIDIVDIFRRSEATPEVVRDTLLRTNKPRCIWLQQGIVSEESRKLTESAGIFYVEDRCTAVEAAFAQRPQMTSRF
ncbi:MAG TPA: CoA-binding protein [Candidatus Kapabacteria bacterium]|nr:CoA-binding protein [Candidatus Kapabacteria bacterium]